MSRAEVGGITVEYDDQGAGEPVVLVHGHPFDRSMWAPQREALAREGWRVIVPDLRGYGGGTVVGGVTPLETFARDIAGLLDHLGVGRVVIGGLSMGGQIVMEFHRLFAHRVRGLLLAATSAPAETPEGRRARAAQADRLLAEGMEGYAREALTGMVAPHTLRARPDVAEHVLAMMLAAPPRGAAAALRGRAERPDYGDMLTRVAVPALVVVGGHDAFTPVREARFIHERIPGSTLHVIEAAAHLPNLERPEEFNTALRRFLAPLAGTPAAQAAG
ncbi:alpha/beta fold hydrolase [Sphaerisporangium sp. TRM90804]|uniref:alpha/beta fold hydrolase n=1 Tax=Sphaerisporangium sp. TRM90804 TaxID=3031113 RepID=UPI002447D709|nr:alpha/beta fold hydrolase [Sphaerisporangium sp. TRM90804]MDH2426142.1 alpha/beta fold hydrolase [Sphaerisporangium sp. TRM90804]